MTGYYTDTLVPERADMGLNHGCGDANNNRMTVAGGEISRITAYDDYTHPCDDHDGGVDVDDLNIHLHRHKNQDHGELRSNLIIMSTTTSNSNSVNTFEREARAKS